MVFPGRKVRIGRKVRSDLPQRESGGEPVPADALFENSGVTQDVDSALVLDPTVEYVSFGNVTDWNALTAFTIVWRFKPDTISGDRVIHSRWSVNPDPERQILFRMQNGSELNALISQTGSDYAALRSPGFTVQANDWMYGIGYDGSLGGVNGLDRLRPLRKRGVGNAWEDVGWSNTFFNLRSDVPTQLHTINDLPEILGRRADLVETGAGGEHRLMLVKYGQKYTPAELDAMNLYSEPVGEPNWDRGYYYDDDLSDAISGVFGSFVTI